MPGRKTFSILVVDAVEERRKHLQMFLAGFPYLVSCCSSPLEAKTLMTGVSSDMMLCGLTKPELPMFELLEHVQRANPRCIRMVYGNGLPSDELLKSVSSGFAHQYFPYPCEQHQLREVVANALTLHSRLSLHKLLDYTGAAGNIAGLPSIIRELEEVLIISGGQPDELVAVLKKEPLLATRLLQLVNSAVFFKSAEIGNLKQAVVFLGTRLLREIVLFLSAMEIFPQAEECRYQAIRVAVHSLQCSRLASFIAGQIAPGREEEVGAAALLHDLGKMMYLSHECHRYMDDIAGHPSYLSSCQELEKEAFGVSHSQLGGALLFWWNMPLATVETAVNHHLPLAELEGVCRSVAIADRCLLGAASQWKADTDLQELPPEYPLEKWKKMAWKLANTLA